MNSDSVPKRILLVEDDEQLSLLISKFLTRNGFDVEVESNGDAVYQRVEQNPPALIVLDVMLPGIDGYTICRRIRKLYGGPVLMLTARGEDVDELTGFESGADDYVRKPVRTQLLLARINALFRREQQIRSTETSKKDAPPDKVACGRLLVDWKQREATFDGKPLRLTTGEFDLLWYLVNHRGYPVTREQLFAEMRGFAYDGLDRSIDLRVAKLRKKLGDDSSDPRIIKSVRGVGYLFVDSP